MAGKVIPDTRHAEWLKELRHVQIWLELAGGAGVTNVGGPLDTSVGYLP